jgi:CRP-like cAMP-binding protein
MSIPWVSPQLEQDLRSVIYYFGETKIVSKNTVLVSEDERTNSFYFVKKGMLGISSVNYIWDKTEIMACICFPNSIAEDGKFALGYRAPVKISALAKSEVVRFNYDIVMKKYYEMGNDTVMRFQRHAAKCLKSASDAYTIIASYHADERIKLFFASLLTANNNIESEDYYTFPVKISRDIISKTTGVCITTVDRLFGKWMREGIIKRDGRGFLQIDGAFLTENMQKAVKFKEL